MSVPIPVLEIGSLLSDLQNFDDVRYQNNVVFAIDTTNPLVLSSYAEVAKIYKE